MQIDWFTAVSQVINFLILLVILKFVLFDRVVEAIDGRQAAIEEQREQAQELRREAEGEREQVERRAQELDEGRTERLRELEDSVEAQRRELEEAALEEVEREQERARARLLEQRRELLTELLRTATQGVTDAARRILAELSDAELEGRVVARLIARLRAADDDERAELERAWAGLDEPLVVRSTRELGPDEREALSEAVRAALPEDAAPTLSFERSEQLVCGIEIVGGGRSLGWSVDDQLAALERELDAALEQQADV